MFKEMVEQVIDRDALEKGEYFIKPSFDDQLVEMHENMKEAEQKINGQLHKAIKDLNLDTVKLEYVSHLGYHFRIALKDESVIRKNNKYRVLDAVKGGARFTTDRLSELNDEFSQAKVACEEQQETIVDEIIRVSSECEHIFFIDSNFEYVLHRLVGYLAPLGVLNYQLAELDCLLSFAVAAVSAPIPYVRPEMHPEGTGLLQLTGLRHPCLELQEDVTFIANDVNFKKGKRAVDRMYYYDTCCTLCN